LIILYYQLDTKRKIKLDNSGLSQNKDQDNHAKSYYNPDGYSCADKATYETWQSTLFHF